MKQLVNYSLVAILLLLLLSSCGKGYQVRFTNYYIEPIDSVVVGNNKLVLKEIKIEETTDFYSLSKGKYSITCISKTKKKFYSSITIPGSGTGKRTIQIDGIKQISVLEE